MLTESLAHGLRNEEGGKITAHLLVPGSTLTAMTAAGLKDKPEGAWTADQVVDMLLEGMGNGDFYIICPDNEVTRETDNKRILWAAQDIIQNRPPLSRWHQDYAQKFAQFLESIPSRTLISGLEDDVLRPVSADGAKRPLQSEAGDDSVATRVSTAFEGTVGVAQDRPGMADALVEISDLFDIMAERLELGDKLGAEPAFQLQALR